jgi:hypothetical protein
MLINLKQPNHFFLPIKLQVSEVNVVISPLVYHVNGAQSSRNVNGRKPSRMRLLLVLGLVLDELFSTCVLWEGILVKKAHTARQVTIVVDV